MKKFLSIILATILALNFVAFASAEEEDSQWPVINIIGDYTDTYSQRAVMHVDVADENIADVTINWANSATEMVCWHFTGVCSEEDLSVTYTDCIKTIVTTDDANSSEEVVYENGTGKLLCNAETFNLTWQDDMEDAGKDCVFVYDTYEETFVKGLAFGVSEAEVRGAFEGEPAEEACGDMKVLAFSDVVLTDGVITTARYFFSDDMLRVMRFTTDQGNADVANSISMWMYENEGSEADLDDETVKKYAAAYCGISDFSVLTYFACYTGTGELMLYIRTSETDIDLLLMDHYAQEISD